MVAEGLAQTGDLDHYLAAVRCRRKLEMDALRRDLVNGNGVHLLQHFDTALHLLRLGGIVAKTLNEIFGILNLLLLILVSANLLFTPFFAKLHIFRIRHPIVVYFP